MDIRDKKLMQLLKKISSSQVKLRSLRVLQQRIVDINYYTLSTFVGYTSSFLAILKVIVSNLFSKNIKELFYELSVTLTLSESFSS